MFIIQLLEKLQLALDKLDSYDSKNALKPNPTKIQVCSFHLKKCEGNQYCGNPKYFGVTLDQSLPFKEPCESTKLKVKVRNNIMKKLISTRWGVVVLFLQEIRCR